MKTGVVERNEERERRIAEKILAGASDRGQRANAWHLYMAENLWFPFTAVCVAERIISPLWIMDEVEVTGLAVESECRLELFVTIRWEDRELAVPLMQLKAGTSATERTKQAMEDWCYWVRMGYEF